jgi:hypothetical protein
MPRLTVGMPVYNGEEFIGEALDAVLAQTYTDFEVVIADNASDDGTPDIIADYAASDPRIRHVRHDRNLGSAGNHNYLAESADTELFKWAAADDLHAPTHFERCIAALDERPELVGAHSRTMRIDENSRLIKPEMYELHTDGPTAHLRFRNIIAKPHSCFQCFAVFRTGVVQQTACMQPFPGSDRVFLAEIALHGPTLEVPEFLLARRVHSGSHSAAPDLDQADKVHFWAGDAAPEAAAPDDTEADEAPSDVSVPHLYTEYLELTDKVPLDPAERRRCRREVKVTHTAAQLWSEVMRLVVYPVRKRMHARTADRVEEDPTAVESPLWTDYLERVESET